MSVYVNNHLQSESTLVCIVKVNKASFLKPIKDIRQCYVLLHSIMYFTYCVPDSAREEHDEQFPLI